MPPRKSNASQIPTTADEATPTKEKDGVNIEDITLPRTMVQRLAKGVLPPNTQIQKDAVTAICKSATVFVNYLSQAANISTIPTTRKAISPEAVLDALAELEFEDFLPRVQAELKRFNELQTGKRNEYRRKLKEKEGTETGVGGARSGGKATDIGQGDGEERAAKRVRREATGMNNATLTNSADKGVASEEVEEDEEEDEAGKDNTLGDEGADEDGTEEEEADEEEEENSAEGSGEERGTDQDELDEADLDERTEVDDEEQSSEDSE